LNETDTRLRPAVAAGEEADPTIAGGDRDAQGNAGRPPPRWRHPGLPTRRGRQIL